MEIQQAIEHAKQVAEKKYTEGMLCHANPNDDELDGCIECAKEHEQLADWLEELQQYRSIGTVDECREAREKQTTKKSIRIIVGAHDSTDGCPVCKKTFYEKVNFCSRCGNAIAWSE